MIYFCSLGGLAGQFCMIYHPYKCRQSKKAPTAKCYAAGAVFDIKFCGKWPVPKKLFFLCHFTAVCAVAVSFAFAAFRSTAFGHIFRSCVV